MHLLFTYRNTVYLSKQNVTYQPEDATAPVPDPPLFSQYFSSKYCNVYNTWICVRLVTATFPNTVYGPMHKSARGRGRPLFATVAPDIDFWMCIQNESYCMRSRTSTMRCILN
ncbi:MAG: hypothetical protein ACKPKO_36755, partial [Candidatus Fonsibacter sp.]